MSAISDEPAPDRFRLLRTLLEQALDLDPAAGGEFLSRACADDPPLRADLEALLRADAAGGVIDRPLGETAAALLGGSSHAAPGEPASPLVGAYRIVASLGAGGMGAVFLAERADGAYQQRVAVKLFHASADLAARFARERRILARLDHPSIARLLDAGVAADGRPYFVLEYVDGAPLTDFARARALDATARAGLLCEVADAVAYAHRNLVVHRDLKPANVLVTGDGRAKLLDFGIAKLLEDDAVLATRTVSGLLTPAYAAPEQLRGEAITTATDVWALGALLYELLADRRPFADATGRVALEHAILHAEPERLRDAPADLAAIALRALAKAPEQRYPSADALADDLRRFAAGLPVRARGASRRYVVSRFVRRHRAAVAAALAGLVLLTASLGAALWQARLARRASDAARLDAERATLARDFLVRLFETTNPAADEALDALSARDMLDRASARLLAGELHAAPLVETDLLDTIGFLRGQRGELGPAVALYRAALAAKRSVYPAGHSEILYTQAVLTNTLVTLGRLDEAAGECSTLLPASAATPATPQNRAIASRACARLAAAQGRYGDALGLYDAAESASRDGSDQGFRALIASDRSVTSLLAGDLTAAANGVAESRRLLASAPDASRAASVEANAAWIASERGDLAGAEAQLAPALAAALKVFGPDHRVTLPLRRRLATVHARDGRAAQALVELADVIGADRRTLGDDDRETVLARGALAEAELEAGKPAGAIATLSGALPALLHALPANHLEVARARTVLARAQAARGDLAAAREALAAAARDLPPGHPFRAALRAAQRTLPAH